MLQAAADGTRGTFAQVPGKYGGLATAPARFQVLLARQDGEPLRLRSLQGLAVLGFFGTVSGQGGFGLIELAQQLEQLLLLGEIAPHRFDPVSQRGMRIDRLLQLRTPGGKGFGFSLQAREFGRSRFGRTGVLLRFPPRLVERAHGLAQAFEPLELANGPFPFGRSRAFFLQPRFGRFALAGGGFDLALGLRQLLGEPLPLRSSFLEVRMGRKDELGPRSDIQLAASGCDRGGSSAQPVQGGASAVSLLELPRQSFSSRERGGGVLLFSAATSFFLRQARALCRRFLDPGAERFF